MFHSQGELSEGKISYDVNSTWGMLQANEIENKSTPTSVKVATISIFTLAFVMFGTLKLTQRIRISDNNYLI